MKEVDIIQLLELLVERTKSEKIEWESLPNGKNRLILSNGSILFEYIFDPMDEQFDYKISLYDNTKVFASYEVSDCLTEEDFQLHDLMNQLRIEIKEVREKAVRVKIASLYDELL